MSSTLTRAIRYGLHDELDELYEFIAGIITRLENVEYEADDGRHTDTEAEHLIRLFNAVEGRVALLDSAGGHEHGEPGESEGRAGLR